MAQGPDDAALRYYASQRDMARVGAEIRRIKALYPGWQPPADLFSSGPKVDEQPVWDRYTAGDLAGANQILERLRTENEGWEPTEDLQTKLADALARDAIQKAAQAGAWPAVLTAAQGRPALLTCNSVDLLWSVAEAFGRTGNLARSFDAYSYVLKTCGDPAERLATIQKATAVLPAQGTQALMALGGVGPDGRGEFESLRYDALRGEMGRVASKLTATLPDTAELTRFADYIAQARSADDAALFGWYFYGQEKWKDAAGWFRAAGQLSTDPKNTEGLVLALRNDDDLPAAVALAYDNRDRSPEIGKIYIEMLSASLTAEGARRPDAASLDRFADVVESSRSALGAQSLGWNLIERDQPEAARAWFEKSVEWQESSEGVMGLAVAAARLKDRAGLKQVKATYEERYPELADFKDAPPAVSRKAVRQAVTSGGKAGGAKSGGRGSAQGKVIAEAQAQFDAGDYRSALATLKRHDDSFGHNRGAEILKGWATLKMKHYSEARAIFKAEDKRASSKDTRFGIGATFNSQYSAW
ncbi:MAG: hypothetical protein ABN488_20000 [Methylobacteriaceae bacterium]